MIKKTYNEGFTTPPNCVNVTTLNEKEIESCKAVATSYDKISHTGAYNEMMLDSGWPNITKTYEERLISYFPSGGDLLCLGCGSGRCLLPFAEHFNVTGVDISPKSIERAQQLIPKGTFQTINILDASFEEESFHVITAPFSIFHLPRKYHQLLLINIHRFLKKGGRFWLVMGDTDQPHFSLNFCGEVLPYSHFDAETNLEMCRQAGLTV